MIFFLRSYPIRTLGQLFHKLAKKLAAVVGESKTLSTPE